MKKIILALAVLSMYSVQSVACNGLLSGAYSCKPDATVMSGNFYLKLQTLEISTSGCNVGDSVVVKSFYDEPKANTVQNLKITDLIKPVELAAGHLTSEKPVSLLNNETELQIGNYSQDPRPGASYRYASVEKITLDNAGSSLKVIYSNYRVTSVGKWIRNQAGFVCTKN
jgi:hypothetical protein